MRRRNSRESRRRAGHVQKYVRVNGATPARVRSRRRAPRSAVHRPGPRPRIRSTLGPASLPGHPAIPTRQAVPAGGPAIPARGRAAEPGAQGVSRAQGEAGRARILERPGRRDRRVHDGRAGRDGRGPCRHWPKDFTVRCQEERSATSSSMPPASTCRTPLGPRPARRLSGTPWRSAWPARSPRATR